MTDELINRRKSNSMNDLLDFTTSDPSPMEIDCSSDAETEAPTLDDIQIWREVSSLLDENKRGKFAQMLISRAQHQPEF